ncbi:hypothetical protein ACLOJK_041948 [Asimina triloba]
MTTNIAFRAPPIPKLLAEMQTTCSPCFFLPLLLTIFFFAFMTMATDTLSLGQSLSGVQTLISQGGRFELGFFPPGQSRKYYIGIWFKEVPQQTVVWVANRQATLPDASSELKISETDGNLLLINHTNLLLINHTNIPTWSSNSTSKISNPTTAVLLDSGNLVLTDSSNSSVVLWQSFDHLTDTLLPGGKFGLNKITRLSHRLISWKNSEDPGLGAYSMQIEDDGTDRFFMMWNECRRYWNTGLWDGGKFRDQTALGYLGYITNYTYITNQYEKSGIYYFTDNSTIARAEKRKWGLSLSYPPPCEVYGLCGSFGVCNENSSVACTCLQGFRPLSSKRWNEGDWSGGCEREVDLSCTANGFDSGRSQEEFMLVPNVQLPSNPQSLTAGGAEECQNTCLDDCSCTAYAYNTGGCYRWSGDLFNLGKLYGTDAGGDLLVRAVRSRADRKGGLTKIFVACSITFVVVLLLLILGLYCWRRRKQQFEAHGVFPGSLVPYRYSDLRRITHDFSEKLGGGSFGSVFKGTLADLSLVAGLGQGEKQFRSEHVNLVRLRGFCSEGSQRLLVYDFMPNGSLDTHLFGKNSRVLDWEKRNQIALEIAKGLAYLHERCRECIVHCDIKPENILLDADFCPKVADFGMAKLVGREYSRVLTTMRGTIGYLAPEWIQGLAITAKADVYSYAMMLFEIVSGRRSTRRSEIANGGYFPLWAAGRIREDDAISLLDPRLEGNSDVEELNRVCRVACWCIQEDERCRPSMGEVVNILEGVAEVNVPPIPKFLQTLLEH